jgi:uncharacterized protein YegP (UPF0339 family)
VGDIHSFSIANERMRMAGKIEIRKRGEKFRFVVLNRSGEKLLQSESFNDKASTRRAAAALSKAVNGAEVLDATTRAAVASPEGGRNGSQAIELTSGQKAALTRKRRARARKAAETRRINKGASTA